MKQYVIDTVPDKVFGEYQKELNRSKRQQYLLGIKAGMPVILGFIPIGVAYSIMAEQSGLTALQTVAMSMMVFAGASQIMAVGMLTQGAGVFTIILATFILNLRHLIMSTCVVNRMQGTKTIVKMLLAFGVTDESFAIFTTLDEEKCSDIFFLGLITVTYSSWQAGTIIGAAASQLLPQIVSESLGIALYAMFIGLLVPNAKKSMKLCGVVFMAAIINYIFNIFMASSWAVIFSTLVSAVIGVFIAGDEV